METGDRGTVMDVLRIIGTDFIPVKISEAGPTDRGGLLNYEVQTSR